MEFSIDELSLIKGSFFQKFISVSIGVCEVIAFTSMYPYIYFVIKNFNIVNDDANVFIYSGYLGAAFALTQFISTSFWIKASSRFGKKSARLYASTGTAFSMVLYGLSTNLYMALLARSLMGFSNGYIYRRRTFVNFFSACRGGRMNGYWFALLNSCVAMNLTKDGGSLFSRYSFLPSNLCISSSIVVLVILGWLLVEKHEQRRYERDIGIEVGDFSKRSSGFEAAKRPHKLDGQEIMVGQLLLDNKMESPEMDNCATKSDTPKVYLPGVEDLSQEDSETEEERELLSPMSLRNCIAGVFIISFQQCIYCIYFEFLPILVASILTVDELKSPLLVRGRFYCRGFIFPYIVTAGLYMAQIILLFNSISTRRVIRIDFLVFINFLLPLYNFTQLKSNERNPIVTFVLLGVSCTTISFVNRISSGHMRILFTKVSSNTSRELIESYAMTVSTLASCAAQIIGGLLISKFDAQGYGELSWWLLSIWSLMTFLNSAVIVK